MAMCAGCGNDYDNCFEVSKDGKTLTFDSFECAINVLAPRCARCGMVIIGHGVEQHATIYCCAHCAAALGHTALVDHA